MISKELDLYFATDKFEQAGRQAEEQMQFYLRRAFTDLSNVFVLNGLRLEFQGEVAQIDHLVLHPFGAVIVESKSVHGTVQINDLGEWTRSFGSKQFGMPSPALQGKRQGKVLHALLTENEASLLPKMIFGTVQTTFGAWVVDVLVAISDTGIIRRHQAHPAPEVCRADQIADQIKAQIVEYRRMNAPLKSSFKDMKEAPRAYSEKEVAGVAAFLKAKHTKLERHAVPASVTPAPAITPTAPAILPTVAASVPQAQPQASQHRANVEASPSQARYTCRACHSPNLQVAFGKFGYYFKCSVCEGNTPIKEKCSTCSNVLKIRKAGREHFLECSACNRSTLFFTNSV